MTSIYQKEIKRGNLKEWDQDPLKPVAVEDIIKMYERGFVGAVCSEEADEELFDIVTYKYGSDVCDRFGFGDSSAGQLIVPFTHIDKFYGRNQWLDGPQGVGNCFVAGTMVTMSDGSKKPIEQIEIGDEVITHQGRARKVVDLIEEQENNSILKFKTKSRQETITCTKDHELFILDTNKEAFKKILASKIKDNDSLLFVTEAEVKPVQISEIKEIPYSGKVYCITVEEDHSFIANGYMSSNCVSRGETYANLITLCTEVASGLPDAVSNFIEILPKDERINQAHCPLACEPVYWFRGHGGHGWICSESTNVSLKYTGAVPRINIDGVGDFRKYDERLGSKFGRRRPGAEIIDKLDNNLFREATKVDSFESLRELLARGFGMNSCGGEGFASKRDENGVAKRRGGWNHCVPSDTVIAGESFKYIKDVNVGDMVYGHDGKLHKVKSFQKKEGPKSILSIRPHGGVPVVCTDKHPLLVYKKAKAKRIAGGGKYDRLQEYSLPGDFESASLPNLKTKSGHTYKAVWCEAGQVCQEDRLVIPKNEFKKSYKVPSWVDSDKKTQAKLRNIEPSEDLAWLFGLYIGDGNAVKNHKVIFTLGNKKDVSRCESILSDFGCSVSVYEKETYSRVVAYNASLANSFREWFGTSSQTKKIPDWLITWDLDAVIAGLAEADGCVTSSGETRISSTSKILIHQVYSILNSQNLKPWIRVVKSGSGYAKQGYNCSKLYELGYSLEEKSKSVKLDMGDYYVSAIKKIEEKKYDDYVYNLEVEDVNSYVADGIAVHNSMGYIGCDDRKEIHKIYGEPLVLILNSWGPRWISGPTKIYGTNIDIPDGSFWARWSDVKRRSVYARSGLNGWKRENLPNLEPDFI